MIIRPNENRKQNIVDSTLNGIYLTAYLKAAATNTLLLNTQYGTSLGFDASQVNIQAIIRRNGKTFSVMNDNLGILGQFNTKLGGAKNWLVGSDYVRPAVGIRHENVRTVFLAFGGHQNIKSTDELEIQVNCGKNAFNASSLDVSSCFLDVNPAYSIGKEVGIYSTYTKVIQQNSSREQFNLGDNVTKIAFLNFEDTDVTQQIIQTITIGSDRLDLSLNLADLINRDQQMYGKQQFIYPYAQSAPSDQMDSYVPAYPQSFVILNDEEIDRANIDLTFDGSKVNASKNVLVYTQFVSSQEILRKSIQMEQKHAQENINKLPVSL